MGNYTDSFGLKRYVGAGEGICKEYDISAKPAEGMYNFLEILVDGKLPTAEELRKDQAKLPKGATIAEIALVSRKGTATNLEIKTVKEDGTSEDLLATMSVASEGQTSLHEEDPIKVYEEDRYFVCSGTISDDAYLSILVKFI